MTVDPVELLIKGILKFFCKIDAQELERIPPTGPLILMVNHVNFLEVPLIHLYTRPRDARGIVKAETLQVPLHGWLAKRWKAILIDRSGQDRSGLREAEAHLADGGIVIIAPEGTRSKDGVLRKAHAGVISLADRTGAPIQGIAHFGGEQVWHNLKRLRRTEISFRTGPILRVKLKGAGTKSERREGALTEAMAILASLLPPRYRGYYRDAAEQTGLENCSFLERLSAEQEEKGVML